jgi:hypothetical protein
MGIPPKGADAAGAEAAGAADVAGAAAAAAAWCFWWGFAAQQVVAKIAAKQRLTRKERTMVIAHPRKDRLVYGSIAARQ